jgi:hypothetical protein
MSDPHCEGDAQTRISPGGTIGKDRGNKTRRATSPIKANAVFG